MNITALAPEAIWKHFNDLNAIPRPSKKEGKVIAFVKTFGESLGLKTTVDETGNVIIRKPATAGMEDRKKVILQAHLDMVCQKNNDKVFDFDKDGIQTLIQGDWVTADGTTLGADNGIGVSSILAILESKTIPHPDLEALFTIDEETGMTGAFGLKPGALSGDILLNLDTEDDDEITIGCAGGVDVTASKKYSTTAVSKKGIALEIKGLLGGHSGAEIHLGRANANVLLSRFLFAGIHNGIQLVSIDAGGLRNAIPREARATFLVEDTNEFLRKAAVLKANILNEFSTVEKSLEIQISNPEINGEALDFDSSCSFIMALKAAHNGVFRMSPEVTGLVEASNNIARITLADGTLEVMCLTRSSVESTKQELADQLSASFELAGMNVACTGSYPGWKPNPGAAILTVMEKIYKEKFGDGLKIVAVHAGLECGIIGAHYPKMEMVSFGPTIKGPHSPDEKVNIASVQKFWGYLKEILKNIPKK